MEPEEFIIQVNTKLFIGNLSFAIEERELTEIISQYGNVVFCKIIRDRDTGKSKGFGFVEMESESAAKIVINQLNSVEVNGRLIRIDFARPRAPKSGGSRPFYNGSN